jgi:hypothetical protein
MEITLKFNTAVEREKLEWEEVRHAQSNEIKISNYNCALYEMDSRLRKKLKYEELNPVVQKVLEGVRDEFWEVLKEYSLEDGLL